MNKRLSLTAWLSRKRSLLPKRPTAQRAFKEIEQGALLIDTRTFEQKNAEGHIPGAIEIGLNVLEWRCHPQSAYRDKRIPSNYTQRILVMCNEGYSSSVAASHLRELGMTNTTDIAGGFQAWKKAGLPVIK